MAAVHKGNAAENRVVRHLREQGWLVASLRHYGCAGDHLAIHPRYRTRVIETKGCKNGTLWQNFRRQDRTELVELAERYDADALLAHSPVASKPIRWLPPETWPGS